MTMGCVIHHKGKEEQIIGPLTCGEQMNLIQDSNPRKWQREDAVEESNESSE